MVRTHELMDGGYGEAEFTGHSNPVLYLIKIHFWRIGHHREQIVSLLCIEDAGATLEGISRADDSATSGLNSLPSIETRPRYTQYFTNLVINILILQQIECTFFEICTDSMEDH